MPPIDRPEQQAIDRQRQQILQELEDWLDLPMLVLSLVWLSLFIVDLIRGLTPLLDAVNLAIWGVFILEFALKLVLAPRKLAYLKTHWLVAISLLLPALRVFRLGRILRVIQTAQALRGLRLLRFLTYTSRSIRSLRANVARRGFGYAIGLSTIVTLAGAAGMYSFELDAPNASGFDSYGTALWWTAMLMTTMGSDYFPQTAAGRTLCFVLAMYAFAVFGYVTATLATFFIGQDADDDESEIVGMKSIAALHDEIIALRTEIKNLSRTDL